MSFLRREAEWLGEDMPWQRRGTLMVRCNISLPASNGTGRHRPKTPDSTEGASQLPQGHSKHSPQSVSSGNRGANETIQKAHPEGAWPLGGSPGPVPSLALEYLPL